MDSGFALRTPRNDKKSVKSSYRAGIRLRRRRLGLGGACFDGRKRRSDTGSGLLMNSRPHKAGSPQKGSEESSIYP